MLEQVRRCFESITVEPMIFIFSLQTAITEMVRQNLFIEKGIYFHAMTSLIYIFFIFSKWEGEIWRCDGETLDAQGGGMIINIMYLTHWLTHNITPLTKLRIPISCSYQ